MQEDDFHKQINRDQILEQIVINLEDDSESDSESIGVEEDEGYEEENASEQLATPLL